MIHPNEEYRRLIPFWQDADAMSNFRWNHNREMLDKYLPREEEEDDWHYTHRQSALLNESIYGNMMKRLCYQFLRRDRCKLSVENLDNLRYAKNNFHFVDEFVLNLLTFGVSHVVSCDLHLFSMKLEPGIRAFHPLRVPVFGPNHIGLERDDHYYFVYSEEGMDTYYKDLGEKEWRHKSREAWNGFMDFRCDTCLFLNERGLPFFSPLVDRQKKWLTSASYKRFAINENMSSHFVIRGILERNPQATIEYEGTPILLVDELPSQDREEFIRCKEMDSSFKERHQANVRQIDMWEEEMASEFFSIMASRDYLMGKIAEIEDVINKHFGCLERHGVKIAIQLNRELDLYNVIENPSPTL